MAFALVLVSVALVVCLYLLMMRSKAPLSAHASDNVPASTTSSQVERNQGGSAKAEVELEKKRRELEDVKKQFAEMKEELKATKKKVFEQKEAGKGDSDLVKARAEVERQASIQLDQTRMELAQAQEQIQKLKADKDDGKRKPAPVAVVAAAPVQVAAAPAPAPLPVQRVIRELSDSDKEKITRAEAGGAKDRQRIAELEKAMKNSKGRADAATHQLKVARTEGTLAKDKFRAIERRVNRLMLERDLMARAIKDLETKSGIRAERVELTPDEAAASDLKVNEKQAAEDKAAEEAQNRAMEASPLPTPAASAPEAVAVPVPAVPPAQA